MEQVIVSKPKLTDFVHDCMSYFYKTKPLLWSNINTFIDTSKSSSGIIKVEKKGYFNLQNFFSYDSPERKIEDLLYGEKKRLFPEVFKVNGRDVYLSNQWASGSRSDGSSYPLMLTDFAKFIPICFGNQYSCRKRGDNWELVENADSVDSVDNQPENNPQSENDGQSGNDGQGENDMGPFSIKYLIDRINETGLIYNPVLVKRFAFSLLSKRFLILSGLAGSGKTQLALAFAKALVEDEDKQMCVVSVGADWTNREPLLGFPNALKEDSYVLPESGVLQLLMAANEKENENKPFFLILDEMNMSYVERYFADFLSVMESGEKIRLWEKKDENQVCISPDSSEPSAPDVLVPDKIALPKNLFIIGTINVDETTYMFSPKVLDRANVIEFKISPDEMKKFFNMKKIQQEHVKIDGKASGMASSFVELASREDLLVKDDEIKTLQKFFVELKKVNAEFGYRSATEIFRFIAQATDNDDSAEKMTPEQIMDAAIVQKLLPKLHGSRKKLDPVLRKLWSFCFEAQESNAENSAKEVEMNAENIKDKKAIYPESADKILRMHEAAENNGFTSFAEA